MHILTKTTTARATDARIPWSKALWSHTATAGGRGRGTLTGGEMRSGLISAMGGGAGAGAGQESAGTTPGGDTEAWGGGVRGTTGPSVTGHGSLIKQYLVWENHSQA